jgi:hypothetical protein
MPLVEQELLILPEKMSSPKVLMGFILLALGASKIFEQLAPSKFHWPEKYRGFVDRYKRGDFPPSPPKKQETLSICRLFDYLLTIPVNCNACMRKCHELYPCLRQVQHRNIVDLWTDIKGGIFPPPPLRNRKLKIEQYEPH